MMPIDLRPLGVAAGMLLAWAIPAVADGCNRMTHDGQGYVVCEVPADREPALRLWQDGADGQPLRNFANVRATLDQGEALAFAMNAGMYHADYRPVGLLVIDGVELQSIVTGASRDNFGMLPNGVFCTGGARPFQVIESRAFADAPPPMPPGHAVGSDAGDRRRSAPAVPGRFRQPIRSQRRGRVAGRADRVVRDL